MQSINSHHTATNDVISIKLADFVFETGVPFATIQSPAFGEFIRCLRPSYIDQIPTINELSNQYLIERYDKVMENVKRLVNECEHYSILSHGWANDSDVMAVNFVVESLDGTKLVVIITDSSFAMEKAREMIEEAFPGAFVGDLIEISAYAMIRGDAKVVAMPVYGFDAVNGDYIRYVEPQNQIPAKNPSIQDPKAYNDFLVKFFSSKDDILEVFEDNPKNSHQNFKQSSKTTHSGTG
ncbi:small nuclear RNA activating complex, polypeptide 3 [Nowakowskiella sp. JEL0407]|nr:small nuclear RNA activating complex, polypeptide 3 [Nowakowskiella sp. JEL0407]